MIRPQTISEKVNMASWSEWFREAEKKGKKLEEVLRVNLPRDLDRLYSSGLPVLERYIQDGAQYNSSRTLDFCRRHPLNWVRVYHKLDHGRRHSKFGISAQEVVQFIESLEIDLSQFKIQLFETHINQFGGNILSDEYRTDIDIAEGAQDIVGKSLAPFFHGTITETGRLAFYEKDVSDKVKKASWDILKYLKLARGQYRRGYFEFIVSDEDRVYFLAYIDTLFR